MSFIKYFRDNVHGDIVIEEKVIYDLINTNFFQRLRRIEQLGGAKYVFLGANHTRFSHCIGVYHVVCKFLNNKNISRAFNDYERLVLKISGLLHDIGHGPFSHTFEWVLKDAEISSHEEYSSKIILEDKEISSILKEYKINSKDICKVIEGKDKKLSPLISSQVDADRIDYLLRDGLLVGVHYADSDVDWIIRNAYYLDDKMYFSYKAIGSLESYLLGRFHMYKQVYLHNTSVAFDETLRSWFERVRDLKNTNYKFNNTNTFNILEEVFSKKAIPIEKYYQLDDYLMMSYFKECINEKDKILSALSDMLVNRKFLKVDEEANEEKYKKIQKKYDKEASKYFSRKQEQSDVFLYRAKKPSEEINISYKNGQIKKLNDISELIHDQSQKTKKINNLYLFKKDYI